MSEHRDDLQEEIKGLTRDNNHLYSENARLVDRVTELERGSYEMSDRWQEVAGDLFRRVSELEVIKIKSDARIVELEAELVRYEKLLLDREAERDRLKAALQEAADWISSDYDIATAKDLPLTRAALSGEGVTK